MSQLIDQDIRQLVIDEVNQSFALAAGAGAGKTTVLVERLTQHLLSGTPPEQIAAITFTRAAANELAARSRDAIESHLARAQAEGDRERVERLAAILDRFSALTLSTIHSFCQELLRREALEACWAPDTKVDDIQGRMALRQVERAWRQGFEARHVRWGLLLRRWVKDVAPYPNALTLADLLTTLNENRDLTPLVADEVLVDFAQAREELASHRSLLDSLMGRCRNPATCELHQRCTKLLATVEQLLSYDDPEACVMAAFEASLTKLTKGNKKNWEPDDKDAVKACGQAIIDWRDSWRACVGTQLHRVLIGDLQEHYLGALAQARLEHAQADFAELLFRAKELLEQNPGARRRLAARYRVLLIDEVQDTDPIQAEVAALLTRPADQTGPWHQSAPRAGSLFAVGDPKQSIYRFRRANIEVWHQLRRLIERNGQTMALRQNFRSVPGIVSWVNHTFAELPDFIPQESWRDSAELPPVALVDVLTSNGEEEIEALTRHLVDLKVRGARVYDKDTRALRPVEDRDFLILLPSWTKAPLIQEALVRAGIECTIEGGYTFFERDEVRLLLDAMRAIEEPRDRKATVAILRGLFGLSHEALAAHHAAGGVWSSLAPSHPTGPVGEALRFLGRLHGLRHRHGWVELLDMLLDHSAAPAVWAMTLRRWSVLANLDKFKTLIAQIEPRTRTSAEVIEVLNHMQRARDEDLSLVDEDNQAARIMTYFKAKGLEAPVVALVHAKPWLPAISRVVVSKDGQDTLATAPANDVSPPGWNSLIKMEKDAFNEEYRRKMYVAATRARDQLVLFRADSKTSSMLLKKGDVARGLPNAITSPENHGAQVEVGPEVVVTTLAASALPEAPSHDATFVEGLDPHVDAILASPLEAGGDPEGEQRVRRLTAAMAASQRASSRWRSVGGLFNPRQRPEGTGDIGPVGGTVVHKVMEHLDLGHPDDLLRQRAPGLVRAFALEAGLSDEKTARCQEVVERLLAHEVIEQARRASERWREVPFAYQHNGAVIAGRIDLCFPTNPEKTRWTVVDWKSHLPPLGTPDRRLYQEQLARYAQAILATVTPCQHVDTVLAGPHEEIGVANSLKEDLEIVREELVELVIDLDAAGLRPQIGVELETTEYVELELAWPDRKLGLGLDLTAAERAVLSREGWTVVEISTLAVTWADAAAAELDLILHFTTALEAP